MSHEEHKKELLQDIATNPQEFEDMCVFFLDQIKLNTDYMQKWERFLVFSGLLEKDAPIPDKDLVFKKHFMSIMFNSIVFDNELAAAKASFLAPSGKLNPSFLIKDKLAIDGILD